VVGIQAPAAPKRKINTLTLYSFHLNFSTAEAVKDGEKLSQKHPIHIYKISIPARKGR